MKQRKNLFFLLAVISLTTHPKDLPRIYLVQSVSDSEARLAYGGIIEIAGDIPQLYLGKQNSRMSVSEILSMSMRNKCL